MTHQRTITGGNPFPAPQWTTATSRLTRRFEYISELLSLSILLFGVSVIIGWLFNITGLLLIEWVKRWGEAAPEPLLARG